MHCHTIFILFKGYLQATGTLLLDPTGMPRNEEHRNREQLGFLPLK